MKAIKKLSALLLCLIICLPFVASCGGKTQPPADTSQNEKNTDSATATDTEKVTSSEGTTTGEKQKTEEKTYLFTENIDRIKLCGRCDVVSAGVTCDWTASGFEVNLVGSGSLKMKLNASAETYFTVFVDGVRESTRVKASSGSGTVELCQIATDGLHTVRVVKQTEALNSICVLNSLTFAGEIGEKPTNNDLYIEFIGDSISCGYGNYNYTENASNPGSALYEDGTIAYPYLTASAMNADYSIVSVSGIGVKNGFTSYCIGDIYEKTSYLRDKEKAYGFERKANLVVINLGTNDETYLAKGIGTESEFKSAVKDLIEKVRTHNGENVPIVWCYNMMNDGCYDWISDVIAELGGEASGLYLCELNKNRDAANGHPSADAHQTASEKLVDFIGTKKVLETKTETESETRTVETLYEEHFDTTDTVNTSAKSADVNTAKGFVALDGLDCQISDGALQCKSTQSSAFFDMQYYNIEGFTKLKQNVMLSMKIKPLTENYSSAHLIDFRFHNGSWMNEKLVVKNCKLLVDGNEAGTLTVGEFTALDIEFCYNSESKLFTSADVYLNGTKVATFAITENVAYIDHFRICRYNTGEWAVDDIIYSKVTYATTGDAE